MRNSSKFKDIAIFGKLLKKPSKLKLFFQKLKDAHIIGNFGQKHLGKTNNFKRGNFTTGRGNRTLRTPAEKV